MSLLSFQPSYHKSSHFNHHASVAFVLDVYCYHNKVSYEKPDNKSDFGHLRVVIRLLLNVFDRFPEQIITRNGCAHL